MTSSTKTICLLTGCVFLPLWLHAQPQEASFRRYTAEEGLASSHISCLLQDSRGFLWAGTASGLYRFDGYNFKAFKRDPADTNSVSDNFINVLYEDRLNRLWVGTTNGLNAFDHRTEKFTHYRNAPANAERAAGNFIAALWGDEFGVLWVGTHGGGVYQFNAASRKFAPVTLNLRNPLKPGWLEVSQILGEDDAIWIGTLRQGLLKFDPGTKTFVQYLHDPANPRSLGSNNIAALFKDHGGLLWVGTHGGGFACFDPNKEQLSTVPIAKPEQQNFKIVSSIVADTEGLLWLGTSGMGLVAFDPQKGSYEIFKNIPRQPQTLSHDWILSQHFDRAGNLWVGTVGGLNKLQLPKKKITHIKNIPNDPNSLVHNNVNAVWQDRQDNLWVGTEGGVSVFDSAGRLITNYTYDPKDEKSLSLNFVQTIREDKNGEIWVGTFGRGLNKLNRKSQTFTRFREVRSEASSLSQDFVTTIYEDRSGDLWIGTLGGLNKLIPPTASESVANSHSAEGKPVPYRFRRFLMNADRPQALSHNGITAILEDRAQRLWIGTYGGGLNRLDKAKEEFTHYVNMRSNPNSLSDNIVHCIFEDEAGILWIGTNGGLNKFNPATEEFHHYLERDGLPNNYVSGILGDREGNLWISTHNGLSKFNDRKPPGHQFLNFDAVKDGLQGNEFGLGAFHQSRSGELFFGGPNGLNRFYPQDLQAKSSKPAIVITGFNKLNKPVMLDTAISAITTLQLSHRDILFSFEFAALDFTLPEKNEYAYKMEGFNGDWIYGGNQPNATFTNLDPGSYVFRVKGANSDGVWNEEGAALRLTVTPPFWKTWWFRFAAGAGIVLLAYGFYRLRLAKAIEIERLRVRIASDLHDDIGATLTKISLHSELIQEFSEPDEIRDSLRRIGAMSRELVTTMSDIVWSIDARNDTIGDLVDRMRDFAAGVLSAKAVAVTFDLAGLEVHKKLPAHLRQNIYLIFKEAINNIAKHAAASQVEVHVRNVDGKFHMTVRDDGKGWHGNEFEKLTGHGLRNMKMRAVRIGGDLDIARNGGCTISLIAPALR